MSSTVNNNKGSYSSYYSEPIFCDICNQNVTRGNMSTHKKSKKHLEKIKINNNYESKIAVLEEKINILVDKFSRFENQINVI